MTAPGELLAERKPNFLHRAAHDWWHGQKCAEHDGDFHTATRSSKTRRRESVARLMSKRRAKKNSAFLFLLFGFPDRQINPSFRRTRTPAESASFAEPAASV